MAGERRQIRRDPNTTRALLLDVTEKVMRDEGYAAVSTRRVAKEAGLTAGLVHYYYATTDDLFIALHQRMTDQQVELLTRALASDQPLQALWDLQADRLSASLGVEFIGLANHRKTIGERISVQAERARGLQAEALQALLSSTSCLPADCPPVALVTLLTAVSRTLVNEQAVGITLGHAELRALAERMIAQFGKFLAVNNRT